MKTLLLLLFLIPTFAFSQTTNTLIAFNTPPGYQKVNLHLYRVNNDAADIKRAKKSIVVGTVLNVTGAALAIFAPQLSDNSDTQKTLKYVGIGVGVTGFAFTIPAIFVLSKNRNKYY
jgi:hypothetical protein